MACKIDHRVENNGLYKILKLSIHGGELCQYLMEKYDWDLNIFSSINWTAHNRELQKVPKHKKPTLLKYIHGWLAWKTRRHSEGQSKTTGCPLCGEPETRAHLFCFAHEQMSILRDTYWKILIKELFKDTAVGFREVFISGLNTIPVLGVESPSSRMQLDWPRAYQEAYTRQEQIGWGQVLYGRITLTVGHFSTIHAGAGNRLQSRDMDTKSYLAKLAVWIGSVDNPEPTNTWYRCRGINKGKAVSETGYTMDVSRVSPHFI